MNRKTLLTVCIVWATVALNAAEPIRWKAQLGVGIAAMPPNVTSHNQTGWEVGVSANIHLKRKCYFIPSLLITRKGLAYSAYEDVDEFKREETDVWNGWLCIGGYHPCYL